MRRRGDIIITSADKGRAIVNQDVIEYIKEAERQLNNVKNYIPLPNDATKISNDTINKTIKRFQKEHLIKDKVADGIITQTQEQHKSLKIHKEGIIGRPVISSVNCYSAKISEYVDYHLQPVVREISSYIKNKNDFLCKIKPITGVPENSYFVTLDVKSLYTSIPNSTGIKPVKLSH